MCRVQNCSLNALVSIYHHGLGHEGIQNIQVKNAIAMLFIFHSIYIENEEDERMKEKNWVRIMLEQMGEMECASCKRLPENRIILKSNFFFWYFLGECGRVTALRQRICFFSLLYFFFSVFAVWTKCQGFFSNYTNNRIFAMK